MKELSECYPGQVVKLWARVVSVEGNPHNDRKTVTLYVPNPFDGCCSLVTPITTTFLAEEVRREEPWPGEVVRAFLRSTDDELAQAERAVEIAWYGEDTEAA